MLWSKWSNLEIIATDKDGREITSDVTCLWCGHRDSVENLIKYEKTGTRESVSVSLDTIQKTGEWRAKFNSLWRQIENKKLNLYEAFFQLNKLNRDFDVDVARGYSGTAEINSHVKGECEKCRQPIGFNIHVKCKIEREIPDTIPMDVLKSLPAPPRKIVARLLRSLGGTIEDVLETINPKRFSEFRLFLDKTDEAFKKLDVKTVEPLLFSEFQDFLKEFRDWTDKQERDCWGRYVRAVSNLAQEDLKQ